MYKYCYIEPIIFTSYLIWYIGRIWNGYVASRFNRIGEIAEVLNSSMTEFFKKNDSVRARPDYLADSINPLPLGKSDMRRDRPSCNGVPNKQMLRTRHHVFEHRNLLPHVSRVIETFPQRAPALFGLLEGALRTHGGYLPTVPIGVSDEDTAVSRKTRRMGLQNCTPVPFVPFHSQIGRKRYESRKMDTCGDCDSDRHSGWGGRLKLAKGYPGKPDTL